MKFVTVRDFRLRPGNVWKDLETEEDIVITSKGKPIAVLLGTSAATFDETVRAVRRSKAELAVSRMRRTAVKRGLPGIPEKGIEAEIKTARKARGRC